MSSTEDASVTLRGGRLVHDNELSSSGYREITNLAESESFVEMQAPPTSPSLASVPELSPSIVSSGVLIGGEKSNAGQSTAPTFVFPRPHPVVDTTVNAASTNSDDNSDSTLPDLITPNTPVSPTDEVKKPFAMVYIREAGTFKEIIQQSDTGKSNAYFLPGPTNTPIVVSNPWAGLLACALEILGTPLYLAPMFVIGAVCLVLHAGIKSLVSLMGKEDALGLIQFIIFNVAQIIAQPIVMILNLGIDFINASFLMKLLALVLGVGLVGVVGFVGMCVFAVQQVGKIGQSF